MTFNFAFLFFDEEFVLQIKPIEKKNIKRGKNNQINLIFLSHLSKKKKTHTHTHIGRKNHPITLHPVPSVQPTPWSPVKSYSSEYFFFFMKTVPPQFSFTFFFSVMSDCSNTFFRRLVFSKASVKWKTRKHFVIVSFFFYIIITTGKKKMKSLQKKWFFYFSPCDVNQLMKGVVSVCFINCFAVGMSVL